MNIPDRVEVVVTKRNRGAGSLFSDKTYRVEVGPIAVIVFLSYPREVTL